MLMSEYKIILASQSPRRRELLKRAGFEFDIKVSGDDEIPCGSSIEEKAISIAGQKARSVKNMTDLSREGGRIIIIGADTIVSCGGRIFGKPRDREDAVRMLSALQGACHEVYTGVCVIICDGESEKCISFCERTRVHVYDMTREETASYVQSGEPMDKAGAYAIQGLFARYIKGIEGDYNNVVGLPISRLYRELKPYIGI